MGDPGPRSRGRGRLTGSGRDRLTRLGRGRLGASLGRVVSCPHALSELRSEGGVGTHVVSQPCVAGHTRLVRAPSSYVELVRGLQEGVQPHCGRCGRTTTWSTLAFAALLLGLPATFALTLKRVGAFASSLSRPFTGPPPGFLRHGCAVLGSLYPELQRDRRLGRAEGKGTAAGKRWGR